MRKVALEQGSDRWLAWRGRSIGATAAAVILDLCPSSWGKSRLRLWEELTGRRTPEPASFVMRRGSAKEPLIRRWYEEQTGIIMQPVCVEDDQRSWLKASLDGMSFDEDVILEIKYPNKDVHRSALGGEVVPHYFAQIQHQLLITGAKRCDYVTHNDMSFEEPEQYAKVEVLPDLTYQWNLLDALQSFWDCVCRDVPPPQLPKPKRRRERKTA